MKRSHIVLIWIVVIALVAFLYAGLAEAQTGTAAPTVYGPQPPAPLEQSFTVEVPLSGAFVGSFEVPRFDPDLGDLVEARIQVDAHHRQAYGVEQLGSGRALFWWGDGPLSASDAACYSYLQISAPSGETVASDLNLWPLVKNPLASFDGTADFAGPSGTITTLLAENDIPARAMNASGLVGRGSATFVVTREGFVWHSGTTANVQGFYTRQVGATVTVSYLYR